MILFLCCLLCKCASPYAVKLIVGSDFPVPSPLTTFESRVNAINIDAPLLFVVGEDYGPCFKNASMALGSEGYSVVFYSVMPSPILCVTGNPGVANSVNASTTVNRGLLYGAYQALRVLGFGFLHQLVPFVPQQQISLSRLVGVNITEQSPQWSVRGFHYHTEHPLELMELLNGVDAGSESWASMVPEFNAYCEWMVANRQNAFESFLLNLDGDSYSTQRVARLRTLAELGQQWGIAIGVDVPIAEIQQHAMHMVNDTSKALAQIQFAVDFIASCGYNYISTDNGFTEFTHGNCTLMLSWFNFLTKYALQAHGLPVFVKCHISTGQYCKDLLDPRTNKPLNFNFLPMMASTDLGIMPHTVQLYRLTDPAPTYGNQNFSYMLDFLTYESPKRATLYHPETAYWVNYDINVPLFLPVYADTRVADANLITARAAIDGQIVFTSGFEWAYWLHDVVAADVAWRARDGVELDLADSLTPIAATLFGDDAGARRQFVALMRALCDAQRQLLIFGNYSGAPVPPGGYTGDGVTKRNGMAYIEGWDTWQDIARFASDLSLLGNTSLMTAPDRLSLELVHVPFFQSPSYVSVVRPLLRAMTLQFGALAPQFAALLPHAVAADYVDELNAAMQVLALRARQVDALYAYAASLNTDQVSITEFDVEFSKLKDAQMMMMKAATLIAQREQHYRVPLSRIASWRDNISAYNFTYLWATKSMQYWWRDYYRAVNNNFTDISPCILNIVSPVNVAFGEGIYLDAVRIAYELFSKFKWARFFDECMVAPRQEPFYNFTNH